MMITLINRVNGGTLSGSSVVCVTIIIYTLMWERMREGFCLGLDV